MANRQHATPTNVEDYWQLFVNRPRLHPPIEAAATPKAAATTTFGRRLERTASQSACRRRRPPAYRG